MRVVAALLILCGSDSAASSASPPETWPAFRGSGDSITQAKQLPLKWSATENIAWTAKLPGYGQSSPVVWKDKVFVTAIEGESKETLHLLCLDLASGKISWQRQFPASQRIKSSDYVSKGAPTPVVTADRVFAMFESGDLLAFDHSGKELWRRDLVKDFGPFTGNHGLGSSPVPAGDSLLILVAQGSPYLLSVDMTTGKDRWRTEHAFGSSWSSPTVYVGTDKKPIALVSSSGVAAAFDVKSGDKIWDMSGLSGNTVASPTIAGELMLLGSSDRASQAGLRIDGKERVAWRSADATSSFGSPLVYEGLGYSVNREGVAYCFDPATGKGIWDTRLPASCWASPIGGAGRVYFFTRDGICVVMKAGKEMDVLAENKLLGKGRVYGVAAVEGAFLVKTGTALIKVGK